jgi:hypothetical protein
MSYKSRYQPSEVLEDSMVLADAALVPETAG